MDSKLRRWELALMLGVALALVLGAWLGASSGHWPIKWSDSTSSPTQTQRRTRP